MFIDLSTRVTGRLPLLIATVVALSFVLLLVPVPFDPGSCQAAVLNVLSITAAYGVVVAVFQWGWGLGLIGLEETMRSSSFVPMVMFRSCSVLSMDYEVFLLSRIREEYLVDRRRSRAWRPVSVHARVNHLRRARDDRGVPLVCPEREHHGEDDRVGLATAGGGAGRFLMKRSVVAESCSLPATMVLLAATRDIGGSPTRWLDPKRCQNSEIEARHLPRQTARLLTARAAVDARSPR